MFAPVRHSLTGEWLGGPEVIRHLPFAAFLGALFIGYIYLEYRYEYDERAIKEGRKLILVPRESPFSAIHLENMLKLARLGVTIMPAAPGFYHQPDSVSDLVDFMVARLLDHLGIEQKLVKRWGE